MTKRAVPRVLMLTALCPLLAGSACDREAEADDSPAAAPSAAAPAAAAPEEEAAAAAGPDEIYFDLTRFAWYREGRPLVHDGREYMPQSDPTPVDVELEQAGTYEGVTYYAPADATEPVYTIYVPVYYQYWQRFTAPPGR